MLIQINRNTHLIGSVSLENPNTLSLSLTQGILSGNSHLCSISSFFSFSFAFKNAIISPI